MPVTICYLRLFAFNRKSEIRMFFLWGFIFTPFCFSLLGAFIMDSPLPCSNVTLLYIVILKRGKGVFIICDVLIYLTWDVVSFLLFLPFIRFYIPSSVDWSSIFTLQISDSQRMLLFFPFTKRVDGHHSDNAHDDTKYQHKPSFFATICFQGILLRWKLFSHWPMLEPSLRTKYPVCYLHYLI